MACWGVGTVATKHVIEAVDPLTLLPLQLGASCLFLLFVALARRERFGWSSQMTRLALLGILNPGLAYALGLLGLASITASLSVLLWAAEPVLIVALAAVLLREHVPAALSSALIVAVIGVVLVVYQPGAVGSGGGIALTLAAVGCCAIYTVLTRRLLLEDSSLTVVLVQQVVALVFAAALATAVSAAGGAGWESMSLDPAGWAAAAGSGILYYGLAFIFYLAGLRHVPASYAGAFLPSSPSSALQPAT
jgi:drug/metabolite transporter (DMT)-like permease